jgi:CelD/BcsL family acetyltransferase involved in cellulose biosynthesis
MDFTILNDFSSIFESEWNTLVEQGISDVPFLRLEYLRQWWQTLGGGEWKNPELVLIFARESDRLIGIAPLFKAEYDGRLELLLLGSIEISDYLDLIVSPDDLPRFLSGLMDFLAQSSQYRGLPFDWYNLPDVSPTLAALKAESERRGLTYREEVYRPTPRIALTGSFEEYLSHVEKKQRHEIRRKMRRALENEIPIRFYIVEEAGTLDSEIDAFFQLMENDANKSNFLTPSMRAHMKSVIQTAFAHGYLWLAFLTVDGVKAAACLNFDYKNKLWGYNSGVSRGFMELSPGWVLLGHQLQWACEHGRAEFDFMRGDEEYKYRFGAVNKYVMRVRVDSN